MIALFALLWIIGYVSIGYACYWRGHNDGVGLGRGLEREYNSNRLRAEHQIRR